MEYRIEKDTIGEVKIPIDKYWGAQTQRSINNFKIGKSYSMPTEVIHSFGILKKAAAFANYDLKVLSKEKKVAISSICDEIINGELYEHFPLVVWQTGSGTQTNMNVNEVISNKYHINTNNSLIDNWRFLSPNDDVNKSQSSNDTFPTSMSIASLKVILHKMIPSINNIINVFKIKSKEFQHIVKIGRTHLMDATPLTLGQEFSAFYSMLEYGLVALKNSIYHLSELALGGTAVGTGINCPKGYDILVADYISNFTGYKFVTAKNKFEALSSHDAIIQCHSSLKQLAISLIKISNDIRMLASGPRCGIGEIIIPANEPGSSIMPGKVNPTQCEALSMVCSQVIGNDISISLGGLQGHYQLNTYKPLIIYNFLNSANLLSDACNSFVINCINGLKPNESRIESNLKNSLMLVTALNNKIGYYKCAEISNLAYSKNITLKEAAISLGYLTSKEFDDWVDPKNMI